jgi:hypothetical protein
LPNFFGSCHCCQKKFPTKLTEFPTKLTEFVPFIFIISQYCPTVKRILPDWLCLPNKLGGLPPPPPPPPGTPMLMIILSLIQLVGSLTPPYGQYTPSAPTCPLALGPTWEKINYQDFGHLHSMVLEQHFDNKYKPIHKQTIFN